jgi:large subunit ribosomal protein L5
LSRLKEKYQKEVVPALIKEFEYKSSMAVPQLKKVVLNMGLGEAIYNIKVLDNAVEELGLIAGQKPVITKAKKVYCRIQTEGGNAHWLYGNVAKRQDV